LARRGAVRARVAETGGGAPAGPASAGGLRRLGSAPRVTHLSADRARGARLINTKSPLEGELEAQRAAEAREAARKEMLADADAIAAGRDAGGAAGERQASGASDVASGPEKNRAGSGKPAAVFGAPIGVGVGGGRDAALNRTASLPPHEKPKAKPTVVKAPASGAANVTGSEGARAGPAGNRNRMPEPPDRSEQDSAAGASQKHLQDMLSDGSFEKYGVGGLDDEFLTIFRRVFASRMVAPEVVQKLGMRHVKGMLLYGPPGTGKTLVAKQLGRLLNAHPPKIVNGPEILQRFVGQSEENMRDLFAPAEKEFKGKGDKSRLHVIIFDEIDAIMKARGSGGATASVVHDNVVNQLLTKLDGMQSLDNVLVVGITNRRDLLDPAVLRPGRLELQVEVGLPDVRGRRQIFNIHTARARASNLLGDCVDVDALAAMTANYSGAEIKGLVGAAQSHALARYLAAFRETVSASEFPSESANESVTVTMEDFSKALFEVRPTLGADEEALDALRPLGTLCSCGTGTRERSPHKRARDALPPLLRAVMRGERGRQSEKNADDENAHSDGAAATESSESSRPVIETLLEDSPFFDRRWLSVLVHGPPGSGTSALTAEAASLVPFPSARVFRSDVAAASGADLERALRAAFDDASKAKVSLLIVDGLDTLLGVPPGDVGFSPKGYSLSGGSFGSTYDSSSAPTTTHAEHTASMVRSLRALLRRPPPAGRRLAVVATTSSPETMRALGVADAFHTHVPVPALSRVEAEKVLAATGAFGEDDGEKAAEFLSSSTPIKVLLRAVSLAQALERDEDALSRAALASTPGGFFGSSGSSERRKSIGLDPTGEAWTTALRRVNLTGAEDDGLGGVFR
jgi:vesicle-fusing ATPase